MCNLSSGFFHHLTSKNFGPGSSIRRESDLFIETLGGNRDSQPIRTEQLKSKEKGYLIFHSWTPADQSVCIWTSRRRAVVRTGANFTVFQASLATP